MTHDLWRQSISNRGRVLAVPAGLALAALGRRGASVGAQDQVTVRLTGAPSSGAEATLLEQVLAEAETAAGVDISFEPVPSEYITKLQTDIAAGSVADVFYLDSLPAPDFMANESLLALDDYMAAAGVTAEDFYPGLISAYQYGGKTYGLPKDWSSLAMVYNSENLTAAGITTPPTTWDELRAAGQALFDATGTARIMIPPSMDRYLPFHYAAGATVLSDDRSQITVDSPEAQTALEFYYGLYRDGLATTPADAGAGWPGDGIAKELADIVFEGNWMFPFLADAAPDLPVGIAEIPAGPAGKATLAFTVSYSIYAGTQVPEQAWGVVNYLTGPEGMANWTSLGLAMPSRPALADAWVAKFPERQPFLASGEYARGWQLGVGGEAFNNDANAELQNLFAGEQDVATTIQGIAEAARNRIQLAPATPVAS